MWLKILVPQRQPKRSGNAKPPAVESAMRRGPLLEFLPLDFGKLR